MTQGKLRSAVHEFAKSFNSNTEQRIFLMKAGMLRSAIYDQTVRINIRQQQLIYLFVGWLIDWLKN